MTRPISYQNSSPNTFIDFPARITTDAPANYNIYEKISAFCADRCLEVRIAAKSIYRSFSFTADELREHIEQIEVYKTAAEGFDVRNPDTLAQIADIADAMSDDVNEYFIDFISF